MFILKIFMLASLTSFSIEAAAALKEQTDNGKLLIHNARWGSLARVEELLKSKAPINYQDEDQKTALLWAVEKRHEKVFNLLLKQGANSSLRDKNGVSIWDIFLSQNKN